MSKKQIRRIGTANPKNLGLPLPKKITTPAPSGTQPASAPQTQAPTPTQSGSNPVDDDFNLVDYLPDDLNMGTSPGGNKP